MSGETTKTSGKKKLSFIVGGTVREADIFVRKNRKRLDDARVITTQMDMVGIYGDRLQEVELLLVGTWVTHVHKVSIIRSAKLRSIKMYTSGGRYYG